MSRIEIENVADMVSTNSDSESSFTEEDNIHIALDTIFYDISNIYKIKRFETSIYGSDLRRLRPGAWLNDKIINLYMLMIMERFKNVYCLSTHTLPLMSGKSMDEIIQWFDDVDILSYKYILIPVHTHAHWSLIIVRKRCIFYLDSLGNIYGKAIRLVKELMESISYSRGIKDFEYFYKAIRQELPRQTNGDDCGVFCCMYARFLVDPDIADMFESYEIVELRAKMLYEIIIGRIVFEYIS